MTSFRIAKSFHANGNVKCVCVIDQNDKPVGLIIQWDELGQEIRTLDAEKCVVIKARKRSVVEGLDAKVASLEARIAELESRLRVAPKLTPEQTRAQFAELILLIDPRSLQRVLMEVSDFDIAGSLLDSTEQIRNALFAACSSNRKKSILEDMEYMSHSNNRMKLVYVEDASGAVGDFQRVEVELVDYSTEYKKSVLNRITQLERMGEIVIARGGYDEVFV